MDGLAKDCTRSHTISVQKGVALSANRRNTGDAPARRHCVLDVLFHGHRPRLHVGLCIVEGELDLEVAVIDAAEPLCRSHLLAAWMPTGLDDERVAVPFAA